MKMKKLYKYIAILFVGMIALCACNDENDFPGVEAEGDYVTLNLSYKPEISKEIVNSRATTEENKLYDLHIYVFNANGDLTGYEKLESGTGAIATPGPFPVTVRAKTGTSYIYAVANINSGAYYKLSDTNKALLNVTTYATNDKTTNEEVNALRAAVEASALNMTTFRNINFNRRYSSSANENFSPTPKDDIFMMSGYLNDGNSVSIQKNSTSGSVVGGDGIIKLYRILAKNTLTIESTSTMGTFIPRSYRLWNVPKTGTLIPQTGLSTNSSYLHVENGVQTNITSADVESSFQTSITGSSITFYYPENLQKINENNTISQWKDREKNTWTTGVNASKTFVNANSKSSYIEIQGDYKSKDGKVTGNVSYTIHLGNFSSTGSLTDFNVIRNNHYLYTVKVNGVEDVKAEAKVVDSNNQTVDNPYAEGLVINATTGTPFIVDAHYEARVLTFTKSSIVALKASHTNQPGYILNIKTAFGNSQQIVNVKNDGVYTMNNVKICSIAEATNIDNATNASIKAQLFQGDADFRWIRFVRNTTSNRISNNAISNHVCKYPGDQWDKTTHSASSETKPNQPWLNVFELLAELYNTGTGNVYTENVDPNNSNSGEVYYTCFIDENYYPNKAWPSYVNKDDRSMQIANNLYISTDQKSIYAEVAYSIAQRSIASFYTKQNIKAFGTEIVDEEDVYHTEAKPTRLGSRSEKYTYYDNMDISNQDAWNGWTSAKETNKNKNWYSKNAKSDYASEVTIIPNSQPLYRAAAKACMSRNRDLNGDGVINDNSNPNVECEIKWYLASVGQYRGLYFAQLEIPAVARLISGDEISEIDATYKGTSYGSANSWPTGNNSDTKGHNFRGKYHYYTSSAKGSAGTFWPEEGLTNNPVQASWGDSRAEMVRCVRTLESPAENSTAPANGISDPELYYSYNPNTRIFTLDGIKVNRAPFATPLGVHNETQDLNELSPKFMVAANDLNINGTTTWSISNVTSRSADSDYCLSYSETGYPAGKWRTPNQKEIALMLSEIPALAGNNQNYAVRTKFSGNDGNIKWHDSPGFMTSGAVINLCNTGSSAKIRCVRDVE